MGFFGAAHGWWGAKKPLPLPKLCHIYPTMVKLDTVIPYLKKIQEIYESRDTHLEFVHRKSANFAKSRNADIDSILIHNL